ncbi:hypothetical protein Sam112_gp38 [Bacillus phage vB_BcM_Sam112]|uniref:Uncharacterized protein n=1 Tax=Bacillus phage vB_BcM_Sam112 TaxID=2663324 RepID=A0A5Q2F3X1_9CAUD|nr:hypothetical protein Sam112_gp38 [Bacillus phage vB_BcM_Sam112]
MSIFFDKVKSYELCGLCGNGADTKLVMQDYNDNCSTQKLCAECEYKLYDALRERQVQKLIRGYASNE